MTRSVEAFTSAAEIEAIDAAAAAKRKEPLKSVIADTPDATWDESMI